jgi:hypothetical protein
VAETTLAAAYGWRIPAADGDERLALWGADHWPCLELEAVPESLGRWGCRIEDVDPVTGDVRASVAKIVGDELIHPLLGNIAAAAAVRGPLTALHGGAFSIDGGAWLLPGISMLGKSTLLAALADAGVPVVCEDVTVIRDERVLAGPRIIDLRPDAARALGVPGVKARGETRHRMMLPPIAAECALAGVVYLTGNDDGAGGVRRLTPGEALGALAALQSADGVIAAAGSQLGLAVLPTYELAVSRGWDRLRSSADALLDVIRSR